jgi:hypothetical protein
MNQPFIPSISYNRFKKIILEIHNQEGNIGVARDLMNSKINESGKSFTFDVFMSICKNYNLDFKYNQKNEDGIINYEIIIMKSGYNYLTMKYNNEKKDITLDLAKELYSVLKIQLLNEYFIKNVESKNI